MRTNYRSTRFFNFKGLDTVTNPAAKHPMSASLLYGIELWPRGTLAKWLGKEEYHDTTIGASVKIESVYQLRLRAGTTKEIVSTNAGKIYYGSAADVWTELDAGLTTTDYKHSCVTYNNEFIITDYGQNNPQSWNGAAAGTSDVDASCPKGLTCGKFKRRLFMFGTVLNPHLAYFSGQDSKVFGASDYLTFDTEPGHTLMGGVAQRDRIVIGKDSSISEIYHTGTTPPFGKQILSSNVGCASPHSWQALPDGTVIFVGWNNVYRVFGSEVRSIGDQIVNYFEASLPGDSINRNKLLNVVSGINYPKHQYWFSACKSGSSTNDILFKYDWETGDWFVGPATISAMGMFRVNGEERLYSGDYAGLVYREDYGNDNNGLDYEGYRDSAWTDLGYPGKKKLLRIEYLLESTGTHDLTVQISKDFDDTTAISDTVSVGGGTYTDSAIWDTSLYGTGKYASAQVETVARIVDGISLGEFEWLKVREATFAKDEFFRIYAYTVWWKPLGHRYITN